MKPKALQQHCSLPKRMQPAVSVSNKEQLLVGESTNVLIKLDIFPYPYLMVPYFCSSYYNRLLSANYESPHSRKSFSYETVCWSLKCIGE
jgi:hypothetical protein